MPVGINGVDKQSVGINGVQVKQTLNAANETVSKGVYDATTLSTVDADLATANIKNGITIFGKVGSADVQDISDATAVEAEVLNPETFYAVGGGIRTGTMPTVALAPGSSAYPAGYHAGDGGGLPAIDADLATGNIKNGITIFNIAGSVDVRDVSDANALVGEVKTGSTFYAVGGARKTGSGTQTLNPANENVPAGYYAATTLSAVDAQLAVGNIKSGINIFGFVGAATVQEIGAADAAVTDVKNPRTFFSVTGAIKTGTMPTVALDPVLNEYPAGYHAGAASLTAVDAHLVVGNIKDGVQIFGVTGTLVEGTDISDANAAVGDVKTGQTFYSVAEPRKTGNMPTVAIVAANDNYPAGYHVGNVGGLEAIDADLAVENIKNGVTIFGKEGTLVGLDYAISEGWLDILAASVADFQANPGTGTPANPERINDNNTGLSTQASLAKYIEVDYGKNVLIYRWRQYGNINHNGDGFFKIQYWDLLLGAYVDWVTDIPIRVTADWSILSSVSKKLTSKVKYITTVADTAFSANFVNEMEIIF